MIVRRVIVDIASGTIFRALLILLGAWFLYVTLDIILLLLCAVILAAALEPAVNWLARYRVPRIAAAGLLYTLLLLVFFGIISLLVQPLATQTIQLVNAIPDTLSTIHDRIPLVPVINEAAVQESILNVSNNLANIGLNVFQQTRTVLTAIFTVVFVFVIALYLIVEQDALKKVARLITPRSHVEYVETVIERVQINIGRWVLAQLALGVIMGVVVGVGLWLLGVKYALLLGLLSGILELVPVIGPIIAAIPGVLVGLSQSLTIGVLTLVFYVLTQQIENHLLVPSIMRRAIGLNPLVTIIAILLGARLAGLVGVVLSVPIATILSVILSDLFSRPVPDDELSA